MISTVVGSNTIRVVQGDITARETVAIVNAANNHLWMGSGVAGAIKAKGGDVIEKEAMAQGPIAVGEAVVTTAGALSNEYVIHAAGMGQDLRTSAEIIAEVTRNSLKRCAERQIESVAFPTIGTGVGGFSMAECARVMLENARAHLADNAYPSLVEFVIWGEIGYGEFLTVFTEMFGGEKPDE